MRPLTLSFPMDLQLDHVYPECTELWERRGTYWRCSTCHMIYYHAEDVARALTAEVRAGELLRKLADSVGGGDA